MELLNTKFVKSFIGASLLSMALSVNAGIITGGTLLDQSGATLIESQLGLGDLDFQNIFSGVAGATATDWHAAVDGINGTISIYDITHNGIDYVVGGYTANNWGAGSFYTRDNTAFLFNFSLGSVHEADASNSAHTFISPSYFATFGNGHSLHGGTGILGTQTNNITADGYVYGLYAYGNNSTSSSVLSPNFGNAAFSGPFVVNALQTFTFSEAAAVDAPEPSTLAILALGMIGLASRRFKKQS